MKQAGANARLRPKPHLYLSLMRAFAVIGDYTIAKTLHKRLWPDSSGTISLAIQEEADHLLMEAAFNAGQVLIMLVLLNITNKKGERYNFTSLCNVIFCINN